MVLEGFGVGRDFRHLGCEAEELDLNKVSVSKMFLMMCNLSGAEGAKAVEDTLGRSGGEQPHHSTSVKMGANCEMGEVDPVMLRGDSLEAED